MASEPEDNIKDEKNPPSISEDDVALLKSYGLGPFSTSSKKLKEIEEMAMKINNFYAVCLSILPINLEISVPPVFAISIC
uniref:Uncharacterized protein n=1 Tax=Leersia perrieri TaxID=77586 RepID=A0A0D9XSC5_9ORYZ